MGSRTRSSGSVLEMARNLDTHTAEQLVKIAVHKAAMGKQLDAGEEQRKVVDPNQHNNSNQNVSNVYNFQQQNGLCQQHKQQQIQEHTQIATQRQFEEQQEQERLKQIHEQQERQRLLQEQQERQRQLQEQEKQRVLQERERQMQLQEQQKQRQLKEQQEKEQQLNEQQERERQRQLFEH